MTRVHFNKSLSRGLRSKVDPKTGFPVPIQEPSPTPEDVPFSRTRTRIRRDPPWSFTDNPPIYLHVELEGSSKREILRLKEVGTTTTDSGRLGETKGRGRYESSVSVDLRPPRVSLPFLRIDGGRTLDGRGVGVFRFLVPLSTTFLWSLVLPPRRSVLDGTDPGREIVTGTESLSCGRYR